MLLKAIIASVLVLAAIPSAFAWGAVGHEVVATIAQIHLHPSVLPVLCDILNSTSGHPDEPECHLASVATWADKLRFKMRWSASMHYINARDDYPPRTCLFPGPRGWAGSAGHNVLSAIRNDSDILQAWATVQEEEPDHGLTLANEALKFFIHFVGDLHMPLHLSGRDRGGNSDKVLFDGRQSNLHSVWDSLLISKTIRTMGRNYTTPLPVPQIEHNLRGTIYDPYVRRIMWEGILGRWKDETLTWLDCPVPQTTSHKSSSRLQRVLSFLPFTSIADDDTDDEVLCPYHWAKSIHQLNCDIVWPEAFDEPPEFRGRGQFQGPLLELDTPEYSGVISQNWIVEKLLAQAGIRLAALLNHLFTNVEHNGLSTL